MVTGAEVPAFTWLGADEGAGGAGREMVGAMREGSVTGVLPCERGSLGRWELCEAGGLGAAACCCAGAVGKDLPELTEGGAGAGLAIAGEAVAFDEYCGVRTAFESAFTEAELPLRGGAAK